MKAIYEVYGKTWWRVSFYKSTTFYDNTPISEFQVEGLDSNRNYMPIEVVELVLSNSKHRFFADKRWVKIEVMRDGKWHMNYNWPVSKFDVSCPLPACKHFEWWKG